MMRPEDLDRLHQREDDACEAAIVLMLAVVFLLGYVSGWAAFT